MQGEEVALRLNRERYRRFSDGKERELYAAVIINDHFHTLGYIYHYVGKPV